MAFRVGLSSRVSGVGFGDGGRGGADSAGACDHQSRGDSSGVVSRRLGAAVFLCLSRAPAISMRCIADRSGLVEYGINRLAFLEHRAASRCELMVGECLSDQCI